ncbi:SWIM zinc finger family protein [Xylanimonas sp. McL0601]|uniref:SWIM zinc finger family protein n=1 Tax=Xylanimonas sp. McL0601 TaxID=3414739 RepID=UPI003CEC4A7B
MLTTRDLPLLTDPGTIGRGERYARQDRVTVVGRSGTEVQAVVAGTDDYHVRVTATGGECDCPVGGFCKHCVAVVVALDEGLVRAGAAGTATADGAGAAAGTNPVLAWAAALDRAALADLMALAAETVPGVYDLLAAAYLTATGDLTELKALVDDVLKPRRSFYEYRHANAYATEAASVADTVAELAETATPELLPLVERAVTLVVRTILRADDSSGMIGDVVAQLLEAHRAAAAGLHGTLDAKARRRLATWLHKFMFDGKQDFFVVDVDRYATALGEVGVAHYAALVDKSAAAAGLTEADLADRRRFRSPASEVRYARQRLAIAARDADRILAAYGGEPTAQHEAIALVEAYDDAGLPRNAVRWARAGAALSPTHRHGVLVDRLVRDADERGDLQEVEELRERHLAVSPSTATFAAWRAAAQASEQWSVSAQERTEEMLRERAPHVLLAVLLAEGRDDDARARARRRRSDVARGVGAAPRPACSDPPRRRAADLPGPDRADAVRHGQERLPPGRAGPAVHACRRSGGRGGAHRTVRGVPCCHRRGEPAPADLHRDLPSQRAAVRWSGARGVSTTCTARAPDGTVTTQRR